MKWLKYVGAIVCVLLIFGALPPVYMIAKGLLSETVDDPFYFGGQLLIYVVMILGLGFLSFNLLNSARKHK